MIHLFVTDFQITGSQFSSSLFHSPNVLVCFSLCVSIIMLGICGCWVTAATLDGFFQWVHVTSGNCCYLQLMSYHRTPPPPSFLLSARNRTHTRFVKRRGPFSLTVFFSRSPLSRDFHPCLLALPYTV